uniref:Sperm flagellar 2 n=1 Tax=Scleropages formosus TaxID=113540 RepID=A0A8C9S639_SCLFO
MSDILCRWLNSELRLSKPVEPKTLCADLANGYLIGEVLHKYDLQPDFHRFSRSRYTANAKLNNYTRLEPTMQLLGVHFDLCFAQALMQEHPGAATRLLYQLYFLLQKKKKAQLSGVAMETLQSTATAHLHRIERGIYSERLRTVVKRDVDNKLQKISQKYERKGQEMLRRSTMAQYEKELELQKVQEERRMKDIEKLRLARKRRNEMMVKIQKATVQIPRPPRKQVLRTLEHQHHKQQEAQVFKKALLSVPSTPFTFSVKTDAALRPEQLAQANDEYIQRIRQRLEEDAAARQQREKRRSRILVLQQEAQEEQEELNRDERLLACLTRQSQQERRLAVQLMQVRQQKEFLRQNRIFREKQYQEQRLREFQEALDRKATQLEHEQETQRETELHRQITAQRAQARYRSHFDTCREVLDQILNLVTKVGEYRLLMDNLIPVKLMREWKELLLLGLPLYGESASPEPSPQELEKLEVLNNQDYDDYTSMTGEWAWPEEGDAKQPPPNNNILGHVVHRLNVIVDPPKPETPPPSFPSFTLKASVLGKVFAGKSGCLARMAQVHGVHVLSTSILIQEALEAFLAGEKVPQAPPKEVTAPYLTDAQHLVRTIHIHPHIRIHTHTRALVDIQVLTSPPQLSARAQHGAALDEVLGKGQAIPDQLLVDIVLEAIRRVPPESGWILDGFPMDLDQAKLLEKALSGIDPEKVERKKNNKKINLVVDPHAKKEAPPPLPALDVVLLMDLSDDLVLDRAAKKRRRSREFRLRVTTPVLQALVLTNLPVNATRRIAAFHDTWPKLEWWYSNRQKILVKVNADEEPDAVFKEKRRVFHGISDVTLHQEFPEYLVPYWENTCTSYVTNIKAAMQNLRAERDLIIQHLYDIRQEFKHYLMRPDLKQEFVTQWQQDYNSIPEDMRADEDTKAELHQRLNDLSERLWDISERRKEEALQERTVLMGDGWLEDHTAMLINHFSTLMQVLSDCLSSSRSLFGTRLAKGHPEGPTLALSTAETYTTGSCSPVGLGFESRLGCLAMDWRPILGVSLTSCVVGLGSCSPRPRRGRAVQTVCVASHSAYFCRSFLFVFYHIFHKPPLEHASINQLVEVSRHHIEAAAQIQHELVLEGPDFFIDGDTRVVPASTPPPCPPPWELPVDNAFTIRQLEALYAQLRKVAPAGRLCAKELSEILEDLASLDMGSDALPELWSNLSASQIQDMVSLVSQDSEVLDWRRFLLSAALPWPLPSQSQLLEVLDRFRATDSQGTGFVTEELYRQTELWFSGESGASPPADSSEPSPFDRLSNLKKFFFALFADLRSPEPRLHYETMLLYFAAHPDRVRGWVRALGVATGRLIYHRPRSAVLLKARPCRAASLAVAVLFLAEKSVRNPSESYYERTDGEAEPGGTEEGKGVSIAALLKVVCHGGTRTSSYNRFHPNWRTWEEYEEVRSAHSFSARTLAITRLSESKTRRRP